MKRYLVVLMLKSEANVRKQLSEALAMIANADFPALWPGLLPELVSQLQSGSLPVKVCDRAFHPLVPLHCPPLRCGSPACGLSRARLPLFFHSLHAVAHSALTHALRAHSLTLRSRTPSTLTHSLRAHSLTPRSLTPSALTHSTLSLRALLPLFFHSHQPSTCLLYTSPSPRD